MALTKITDKQVTYKQGSSGSVVRNLGEKLREVVSPEDFGAVGDGVADDTAALNSFFSAGVSVGQIPPSATYKITAPVVAPAGMTVRGALSLLVDANSANQADSALTVLGALTIDKVAVHVAPGRVWSRCVTTKTGATLIVSEVRLTSADQQTNFTGASNSAVFCERSTLIDIGFFYASNFDRVMWVTGVDVCKIESFEWWSCCRGLQTSATNAYGDLTAPVKRGCTNLRIGGGVGHGNSPNAASIPGHNILTLGAILNADIGTCYIYDTGEHGIRVFSNEDANTVASNIHFASQYIYRPGNCGFKASSGGGTIEALEILNLSIEGLYVEDAGRDIDAQTGTTYDTNDNHYPLFLDRVDNCNIGWFKTRKVSNNFNGKCSAKLRNCSSLSIDLFEAYGPFADGILLQNNIEGGNNIRISKGHIDGYGVGGLGGAGVLFFSSSATYRHVYVDLDLTNGVDGIDFSGLSGSFTQPAIFSGWYQNLTGTVFPTTIPANARNQLQPTSTLFTTHVTSGTDTFESYTVGQILAVFYGTGNPARNAIKNIYRSSASTGRFVTSDSGEATAGGQLSGTWRCKGQMSDNFALFQRIA